MNSITLSRQQIADIEAGRQIDLPRFGLLFYAVADEYGEYQTPNGTRFSVGMYSLNPDWLEVKFR